MDSLVYVFWPLAAGAVIYAYLPFTFPVLFLAMLVFLTVKIRNVNSLTFWSDAVVPSLKFTAIQLAAYAATVVLATLLSPLVFLLGAVLFHVIQIYVGQKTIHRIIGKGQNMWTTKAFGVPAAIVVLVFVYAPFIALYVWAKF